ncbi:DsbA family protein [Virgibacillus xinjiangensis]|uniref:DsbA family protein n=1 Tax=Virgibacillus xinjiangensis TaxID=393090 RepID=A0ABV7CVZ7_9BACI
MKDKNSTLKIAVIITIVVFGLIAALVVLNNNQTTDQIESTGEQPPIEGQPTMGEADAPVSVVEFGDFKCPSCKAWGEMIYPQLLNDYVDTGKIQFSYINTLFHGEESRLAALAAESVYSQNSDAYWDFQKALYDEQPDAHDMEWVTEEKILEVAGKISGIGTDQLATDLEEKTFMEEVNEDEELVSEFNVQFTPSIMINDIMVEDPFDYEAITDLIDQELERTEE